MVLIRLDWIKLCCPVPVQQNAVAKRVIWCVVKHDIALFKGGMVKLTSFD